MDGEVTVELVKLDEPAVPAGQERLDRPRGRAGRPADGPHRAAGRGHMALLPANAAYRFHAERPSVILLQTILGDDTVERWAEICLS